MATHDTHGMDRSAGNGGAMEAGDGGVFDLLSRLSRTTAPLNPWGAPSPSGFRGIDRLLPAGGICRGSLLEWIGGPASGATALACAVACRVLATHRSGTIVVVDRPGRFHPPAVFPWLESIPRPHSPSGREAGRGRGCGPLVVVRPARDEDEIWAVDQALRCPGVAAVVAWPERVSGTAMRRWQLAARSGGAVGLLVRPVRARREPSWAQARFDVSAACSTDTRRMDAVAGQCPGPPHAVRLVDSLGVRRMRVSLVEGPWACDRPPDARIADVALDLSTGREAFVEGRFARTGNLLSDVGATAPDGDRGAADSGREGRGGGRTLRTEVRVLPGGAQCRAS